MQVIFGMYVHVCTYIHIRLCVHACIHTYNIIRMCTSVYTAATPVVHVYAGPCTEWPEAASGETYWRHPVPQRHQLSKTGDSNQTYIACIERSVLGVSLVSRFTVCIWCVLMTLCVYGFILQFDAINLNQIRVNKLTFNKRSNDEIPMQQCIISCCNHVIGPTRFLLDRKGITLVGRAFALPRTLALLCLACFALSAFLKEK